MLHLQEPPEFFIFLFFLKISEGERLCFIYTAEPHINPVFSYSLGPLHSAHTVLGQSSDKYSP